MILIEDWKKYWERLLGGNLKSNYISAAKFFSNILHALLSLSNSKAFLINLWAAYINYLSQFYNSTFNLSCIYMAYTFRIKADIYVSSIYRALVASYSDRSYFSS